MKNQQNLFNLFAAALTPVLFLASGASAGADTCTTQCSQAPQKPFSWNEAAADFANGVAPTLLQLEGSWATGALVNLPGYPVDQMQQPDSYNPGSTVNNTDGSIYEQLTFFQQDAFDGSSQLLANILNLGSSGANHGPVVVSFSPGEACFGQVLASSVQTKTYNENFSCRLLAGNVNKMICSVVLVLSPGVDWMADVVPYNNVLITYLAYDKSQ